jgi:hypothetical protein
MERSDNLNSTFVVRHSKVIRHSLESYHRRKTACGSFGAIGKKFIRPALSAHLAGFNIFC